MGSKDILKVFLDSRLRAKWDTFLKDIELICKIDDHNDIVRLSLGDSNDLCLLRSWRLPTIGSSSNQCIISYHSIVHPDCPEVENIKRGVIQTSGFILTDMDDNRIKVAYLMRTSGSALQTTLDNIPEATFARFKKLQEWYSSL